LKGFSFPTAIIRVDKQAGLSSHGVVSRVRRVLGISRVGHTGTLDPQATGLILVCISEATKLARALQGLDKQYEAVIGLGLTTETDDVEGEVTGEYECPPLDEAKILQVLARFVGEVKQLPPRYCALKLGGKPYYKRARAGEDVLPPPRKVRIEAIRLLGFSDSEIRVGVECSSGTYLRSLARDIGKELGCGAFLKGLRRTRIGHVGVEGALGSAELASVSPEALLGRAEQDTRMVLRSFPRITVSEAQAKALRNGALPEDESFRAQARELEGSPWVLVSDPAGGIVALASGEPGPGGFPLTVRRVLNE